MFSNKRPMDSNLIDWQLNLFSESLDKLCKFSDDWMENWRLLSDLANMSETYVTHNNGVWKVSPREHITLEDKDGVIQDVIQILAQNGISGKNNEPFSITEDEREKIEDLMDCYREIISLITASEANKCKNITNDRIKKILRGNVTDQDIVL